MSALTELYREIARCRECEELARTRNKVVRGEGPENSQIVFIGEAPGFHEDQQGRPFVGQAGQFLEQLLGSIGLQAGVFQCAAQHHERRRFEQPDVGITRPAGMGSHGEDAVRQRRAQPRRIGRREPVSAKAIGAFPGSLGTRKVPQRMATINGMPKARANRSQPSPFCQPQTPSASKAANSSRKRTARLIGCELMLHSVR